MASIQNRHFMDPQRFMEQVTGHSDPTSNFNNLVFNSASHQLFFLYKHWYQLHKHFWSRGYGRRLMFERFWVQILGLCTGWTWHFSHWFVVKIVMFIWKYQKEAAVCPFKNISDFTGHQTYNVVWTGIPFTACSKWLDISTSTSHALSGLLFLIVMV